MSLTLTHDIFFEVDVPADLTESTLSKLLRFALEAEGVSGAWHIELVLGADDLLQRLHREFMGIDSPTDTMTFPEHEDFGDPEAPRGGQIVVSVDRAKDQATEYGQSLTDEIRFLVVHGVLHLCGWDDATDADRTRMLDRQTALLRDFDRRAGNRGG